MPRKTLILFVLSAFIVTLTVTSALAGVSSAVKKNKIVTGLEESNGEYVNTPHYSPSASPGLTMGYTWYDYQANGTPGRQVSLMPGSSYLHFVWMKGHSPTSDTARKIAYNVRNLTVGAWVHGSGAAGGKIYPQGDINEIGGYTSCDVRSDGAVVIAFHGGPDADNYGTRAGYDAGAPNGFITFGQAPKPPNCEDIVTGKFELDSKYIWPVVDWSDSAGTSIIQVVSLESPPSSASAGEIQSVIYYRQEANGSWGCGRFIDSVYNVSPLIRVDPTDNAHVIIAYLKPVYYENDPNDPCGLTQWDNDVVYVESFDYGKTWTNFVNVTDYSQGGTVDISTLPNGLAYTDLTAMFDTNGKLHIVWNTALRDVAAGEGCSPDASRSRIWHWDDGPSGCITIVYDASTPGKDNNPGVWNLSASKPNISECNGKFYVSFTRFGADASGDYNLDNSAGGFANGEIFLTASTSDGVTWGEAINLTNSPSPDCEAGDCDSDHWPTMAIYSSDSVHIEYVNDKDAGGWAGGAQAEGVGTDNPVNYLAYDCFTPAGYCNVGFTPNSIGYPMWIAPNDGSTGCTGDIDTTFTISLVNVGNQNTTYTITESSDPDNIIAGITNSSASLPAGCGNTAEAVVTLGPVASEGVYNAEISIDACGTTIGTIPIQLFVYCDFFVPESQTLSTSCWSIGVWNTPRAGLAQRDDQGNMYWFTLDDYFMYDEGLIVTYANDVSNTTFSMFDGSDSEREFRALSPLTVTEVTGEYTYATGEFATQDTAITGVSEYWIPSHPDTCVMIERFKICNNSDAAITIHLGEGIDWDIPDGGKDHGGIDESRNMIYQYSGEPGSESNYGGASICTNIPGAAIMQNDEWVYPNSGYTPDSIGDFLATHTGWVNWENTDPDSAEDLSCTYVIAQNLTLEVDSCYFYCKVKASTTGGLTELQALIDKGKAWITDHGIECGGGGGPSCLPGDADGSGGVDIDDVVYLINYIFGGGPEPVEDVCCGDADGSGAVDIDDVVYLINYIFGGGPAPVDVC